MIGVILTMVVIGVGVLIANGIWIIYRIVKGWLALHEGKPMYQDGASVREIPNER